MISASAILTPNTCCSSLKSLLDLIALNKWINHSDLVKMIIVKWLLIQFN